MRCGCANCDTFMVNDDGRRMGCVCPNCGYRCTACLGTDTVIDRDAIASFRAVAAARMRADEARARQEEND